MSVTLHTTLGDIKIEAFCESVPKTAYSSVHRQWVSKPVRALANSARNFLALCATGYYDASPIHRLVPTFIMQTGVPARSNPQWVKGGQSIYARASEPEPFFENEIRPSLRHNARGIVGMANKDKEEVSNGSQFYITFQAHPTLDGKSTVFGHVLEGMEVLDKIEKAELVPGKSKPKDEIRIERVTIHANPLADS